MKILIKTNKSQKEIIEKFLNSIGIKFIKDFNPIKMVRSMDFSLIMKSDIISDHKKLVFLDIILKYFNLQVIETEEGLEIDYISTNDTETKRANEALNFVVLEKTKKETTEIS